jgi:hypothetical protein
MLMVAKRRFLRTMFYRMTALSGSGAILNADDGRPVVIPALERFRLVQRSAGEGKGHIKIYELK